MTSSDLSYLVLPFMLLGVLLGLIMANYISIRNYNRLEKGKGSYKNTILKYIKKVARNEF